MGISAGRDTLREGVEEGGGDLGGDGEGGTVQAVGEQEHEGLHQAVAPGRPLGPSNILYP